MASDFDQDVATIARVTKGGTSGGTTSSKRAPGKGSSLMSTMGAPAAEQRLDLDETSDAVDDAVGCSAS